MKKTVIVTGASSFTGTWISHIFATQNWHVISLFSKPESQYSGIKKKRIEALRRETLQVFGMTTDDSQMTNWVKRFFSGKKTEPKDSSPPLIWIHHHHWMENFRSLDYDVALSEKIGIAPLSQLMSTLSEADFQGIIFSGSYFEPGEGGNSIDGTETPYAKSKKKVWETLLLEANKNQIPLSKIVIPDPVGPMENEDRLLPLLIKAAQGDFFEMRGAQTIADRIPADVLAHLYVDAAEALLSGQETIARPSGFVGSNRDWIEFVHKGFLEKYLKSSWHPELDAGTHSGVGTHSGISSLRIAPMKSYRNPDKPLREIDWDSFFENYARYTEGGSPWPQS